MGIRHVKKVCLVLAAVATATTAGCKGFNEGIAIPTTAGILEGSIALNQEADLDLIRMAAPASLKTVESFLMARPDQPILLAIVFAGKGVRALQEAGVVSITPMLAPRLDWLGMFPTVQTVAAQALFGLLLLASTAWWLRGRLGRRTAAAEAPAVGDGPA